MVAPVPLRDPATAVLTDPQVPESHRFCGSCGEPVGRGRAGTPGRVEGFCPKDRTPFTFRPRLSPGDLVDDRYEILGALAHGGLGWIYLARDRNISDSGADRWVVLKGLINSGDADAMASAVAERRFLVEVDHPNIVKIHDFARHTDPATGESVGYIVMEYVGGRSLKELALASVGPDGRRAPLPLDLVLAYAIEVLPAMGYLHERGLLFCDFKPDNVIHAEEQLKLIDLGAVRRDDDHTSALWGTPGYQAPELATRGASVASDIYTVGRALAVLSFDFSGFSTRYADRLPDPGEVDLLTREHSYHRLLARATHPDPHRRFGSAGEMAEQALGVLREVLSAADATPRPAPSTRFAPERSAFGTDVLSTVEATAVAVALPQPLIEATDPAASLLATLGGVDQRTVLTTLQAVREPTIEVRLRLVRAHLEHGDTDNATAALRAIPADDGDWRLDWYAGLVALGAGAPAAAAEAFDAVYGTLPGEPAAGLALAAALELAGDGDAAAHRYRRVWRVDHGFVSAAFGLARTLFAAGDRSGAVAILDEIPDSSIQHVPAQIAAVRMSLHSGPGVPTEDDLVAASDRLERLRLDKERRAALVAEMLNGALRLLAPDGGPAPRSGPAPAGQSWARVVREGLARTALARHRIARGSPEGPAFLGVALREREVRLGLERAYRVLASLQTDPQVRDRLVDDANSVRPRTVL